MDVLRVLSTLAVKGAFAELAKRFEAATGIGISADFAPTLGLGVKGHQGADVTPVVDDGGRSAERSLECCHRALSSVRRSTP